jgi:hypothetical protein
MFRLPWCMGPKHPQNLLAAAALRQGYLSAPVGLLHGRWLQLCMKQWVRAFLLCWHCGKRWSSSRMALLSGRREWRGC